MNSLILAPVRIRFAPHPLRGDVFEAQADAGQSLAAILGDAVPEARVWIGEHEIAREDWPAIKPEPGDVVAVRVVPRGGGGKNPLSTILTLGAMAAVAAMPLSLAGSPFLGALARAGVGLGASLLINALVPPQVPETPKAGPEFVNRPGISGIQNRMAPYEPVPRVYGSRRVYPPLAARPYTEVVGQEQYLRLLFSFGYGPLDISDIRIGETPIGDYEDVKYLIGAAPSLYSKDIWQEDLAVAINEDAEGIWTTRTTQENANEISLDFLLPQGLWGADKTPETPDDCYILLKIEYSPAGANTWTNVRNASGIVFSSSLIGTAARQGIDPGSDKFIVHGALKETGYFGLRFLSGGSGQYDVRVQRVASGDPTGDSAETFTDLTWTALRTITQTAPVEHPGTVLMAMRIRATGQLNGVIDQLNAQVQSRLQVWNGTAWVEQATSNCAWVYADILCGSANARAVARSKLDVASLSAWAAEGWEFHHIYDSATSVFDAARDVAAAGRAAWAMVNGKYGVVRDTVYPAPVQVFTPRNSRAFESRRDYHDQPHALRVRFINAEGEQDEITVYDDGYNSSNATKFEVLELLRGIKNEDTAWKLGRYHIAQGRLRPFTFTLETDFEHLVATRGDTVLVAHDEPMWGSGWGRIVAIAGSAITLDDTAPIDPATNYVARLRLSDGTIALRNIVNPPGGDVSVFDLESVPAGLAVGDLVVIGISTQETRELKIVEVEPGPDLSARLRMVDVAPEIYEADTGPIPPYEDRITFPLDYSKILPPAPVIVEVRSDSTIYKPEADGTFRALVQIAFRLPAGVSLPGLQVEGRFIRYDNAGHAVGKWQTVAPVESADGVIDFERVSVGKTYRFEIRARNGEKVSPWAGINHTVLGGVRRKIVSFRQETAPTASESFDGDRWVKPSTGEEFEWRDNAWVPVATHDTPARLLEKLTGQITESQLNQDLSEKINLTYDAAAIEAMLLTGDSSKVHQGDTAPADPVATPVWIDTSGAQPVLKRWDGGAWVVDTTAHIDSVRARVTTVEGAVDTQATAVSDLDTRVTTVEGTTTTQASEITALSARLGTLPVLVENGGFENGLTGWTSDKPVATATVTGSNGNACRLLANAAYSGATWVMNNGVVFDCKPGDRFALSLRATYAAAVPPAGSYVTAYITFYNAAGSQLFSGAAATVNRSEVDAAGGGTQWADKRAVTGVPAGAVRGKVSVGVNAHTTAGSYWYWDDVRAELLPREGDLPAIEANAQAVTTLDARVTSAEGEIGAHSSQITALQTEINNIEGDTDANSTAITSLNSRVTTAEGNISVHSSEITSLSAEIDNANNVLDAHAGAISSLETEVSSLDGEVSAQTTSLNAISARVGVLQVLVENGGFENELQGWTTDKPLTTQTMATSNGEACRLAADAAYSGSTWVMNNNVVFDCKNNDRFAISLRGTYSGAVPLSSSYVTAYITFYNAAGSQLFSGAAATVDRADVDAAGGGTQWAAKRIITSVPSGAVRGRLTIGVNAHTASGSVWWWDDVRVELLPREGDFPTIAANEATIAQEQIVRADADSALASDITTVSSTVNGHTTTIQQHTSSINGLQGQYTVKIDTGDRVIGFGLASGSPGTATSSFLVKADRFAVGAPGAANGFPFIVDAADNKVVMDNAFIRNLSASQISVGWSNLVENGTFEQGLEGWSTAQPIEISTLTGAVGKMCRIAGKSSFSGFAGVTQNSLKFDTAYADKFFLSFRATYSGAAPPSDSLVYAQIAFERADGSVVNSSQVAQVSVADVNAAGGGANWVEAHTIIPRPSGTVRGYVSITVFNHTNASAYWNWDDVVCTRATTGVLIDNGAVTAPKIAGNAVNNSHIANDAIDAAKIAANAIQGVHITSDAITAPKIAANAIGAAHVNTRVLTADKIVVGTLTYNEVGLNQMTVPVFAYTSGEVQVASGGSATIQSLNISTIGRPVQIFLSVEVKKDSSGMAAFDITIKRDGVTLVTYSTDIYGEYMVRTVAYVDTAPGSGSKNYTVTVGGLDGVVSRYRRRMLTVSEVRR